MNRNQFLSVLKSDIDGLDKYSKLDNSKVLLEKEPEAFDYFISLFNIKLKMTHKDISLY